MRKRGHSILREVMNGIHLFGLFLALCCGASQSEAKDKMNTLTVKGNHLPDVFPKGAEITANFVGKAWLSMLVNNKACDIAVYNVTFAPGCRNSWHKHAVGQLLLCTAGVGYYQERGPDARRLLPGDVVEIPADVEHWHGAAPDSEFAHIGITPKMSENGVVWLNPVTDEEYAAATTAVTE